MEKRSWDLLTDAQAMALLDYTVGDLAGVSVGNGDATESNMLLTDLVDVEETKAALNLRRGTCGRHSKLQIEFKKGGHQQRTLGQRQVHQTDDQQYSAGRFPDGFRARVQIPPLEAFERGPSLGDVAGSSRLWGY